MAITREEKIFVDSIARDMLIETVNNTSQKNNKSLINYVLYELSYENAVLMAGRNLVSEDLETDNKLASSEKGIKTLASIPFAVAASSIAGVVGGGIPGMYAALFATLGLTAGLGLLSKVIRARLSVFLDKNKKKCASMINDRDPAYSEAVKHCVIKEKIKQYDLLIADLNKQRRLCQQTANPENCQAGILKQMGSLKSKKMRDAVYANKIAMKMNEKRSGEKQKQQKLNTTNTKNAAEISGGGYNDFYGDNVV